MNNCGLSPNILNCGLSPNILTYLICPKLAVQKLLCVQACVEIEEVLHGLKL